MKIAKIKGIEIKLHFTTLLIVALVGFYAASFYAGIAPNTPIFELIVVGLISGIIILFSILAHELSHSIVALRYGLNVSEIELYIFGGVSKIEDEPRTPKSELVISIVGPLSSLLIGTILVGVNFIPITFPTMISVILLYAGISNIILGIFNLLPAFPTDGGRVLRAILWRSRNNFISATKTASKVGVGLAYGLITFGVFQIFTSGFINGFWLIIMGFFLRSSARNSYTQTINDMTLSSLSVKEMLTLPIGIPFELTVLDAIREYFIPYKRDYFPVVRGNRIVGIIHSADIRKIPVGLRAEHIVGYSMRKISEFPYIDENQTGKDVVKKLNQTNGQPHIVIVRGENNEGLIGFIGEEDLISALKFSGLNLQKS